MELSVTFEQPVMFNPCNRLQLREMAFIDRSVISPRPVKSSASNLGLFASTPTSPTSVTEEQFVSVRRSSRVQTESGIIVPSFKCSYKNVKFNRFIKKAYGNIPLSFCIVCTRLSRLCSVTCGRSHSNSTAHRAHDLQTNMQDRRSCGDTSRPKMANNSSGGR